MNRHLPTGDEPNLRPPIGGGGGPGGPGGGGGIAILFVYLQLKRKFDQKYVNISFVLKWSNCEWQKNNEPGQ